MMKKKPATTAQNSQNGLESPAFIFTNLEATQQYLLEILKGPFSYYEMLKKGIEAFPSLRTQDRINLLNELLFATTQYNTLSVHNFHDIINVQLEKEKSILAHEIRTGKMVVATEGNSNICTLSPPELIVFDGTITELGNFIGATVATKLNKQNHLMFHIEQDALALIVQKTFVTIRGESLNLNSLLRYISQGWNNPEIALNNS